MIKAIKVIYWLANEIIPFSKYKSLLSICKELDMPGLQPFSVGNTNRITYSSYYTADELLEALCVTIDEDINNLIAKSPYISVLCDESTYISNTARMTTNLHVSYINFQKQVQLEVYLLIILNMKMVLGKGCLGKVLKCFKQDYRHS